MSTSSFLPVKYETDFIIVHRIRTENFPSDNFAFFHLLMECIRFNAGREELLEKLGMDKLQDGVMNTVLSNPNTKEACLLFKLLSL